MLSSNKVRNIGLGVSLLIILACGGGGDDTPSTVYPLNRSFSVNVTNNSTLPVHVFVQPHDFPAGRVEPGQSTAYVAPQKTWQTASSTQTLTFIAGRNGSILDQETVTLTGQEAGMTSGFTAVVSINDTLTITRQTH